MRQIISDEQQEYQYFVTVQNVGQFKMFRVETKYLGAKFPDAVQTKLEIFLNENEYQKLKEILNNN
jgi:hypothetical protein